LSSQRAQLQQALSEQLGRQLSAYTLMFHQAMAERLGLNSTDLKCLDLARGEKTLTAGRLAYLTGLTTAAVTTILDRLEEAGFVRRERDPSDRRKILVRPLAGRAEEVARLFAPLDRALSQLYEQYTTEELAFLNEFALHVGQILQNETARLHEQSDLETSEEQR
jgi:DNA-binding MarR family transcriptional regulator